jgi:hypothetical protein
MYSFEGNRPEVLIQTVTTVWRTELGTTLFIGFNSTTEISAYFRYLCVLYFAAKRGSTPPFLSSYGLARAGKLLFSD